LSVEGVSFANAYSVLSSSMGVTGDEARGEGGATAAVSASVAPTADVIGAASGTMGIMPPAALTSPSVSFVGDGSRDIMSFTGLGALRVFLFFFLGRLCGGVRIR
jgi:hypothetical protein